MITYSKLGQPGHGNLGNQLFQIASTIGLGHEFGHDPYFPLWKYSKHLRNWKFPLSANNNQPAVVLTEKHYHHYQWPLPFGGPNVDMRGWLQSEKYFERDSENIRDIFKFSDDLRQKVFGRLPQGVDEKETIAISIRRGDYVGNPNYAQIPVTYYIGALMEHFPMWNKQYQLIFFSDDMAYCHAHFDCLDNAFFCDGFDAIEQLCLMSHCDNFIIPNSTFSWWGAWLGEKSGGKIVRPAYLFDGEMEKKNDSKDFYPERWTIFDHKASKLNLSDVTFTIPVHHDSADRSQNLSLSVCMLQRDFHTNIIVGEQGSRSFAHYANFPGCRYVRFDDMAEFHRTKMLNDMAMIAETPIIVNYDCDVFTPPMQLVLAAGFIRKGSDMVYPYDGRFARVPRQVWFKKLEKLLDVGIFGMTKFKGANSHDVMSVGGAIVFKKESFIQGGMENEKLINYGPEDLERYFRFKTLGFDVHNVRGKIFHMDHYVGINGPNTNPHFRANHKYWDSLKQMNEDQLRAEIEEWGWVHKYTENYYATISPSAVESAKQVWEEFCGLYGAPGNVIDIGCGVGEWGQTIHPCDYYGVDFRIPKSALLIPESKYIEYDLTSGEPFPIKENSLGQKFNTVLCLEVAEHLPPEHAENLVKLLCSLGTRVVFSAAIPHQGGVGHVNEQWPSYWVELFEKFNFYLAEKQLRNRLMHFDVIDIWYRNNIIVLEKDLPRGRLHHIEPIDFVHPRMYLNIVENLKQKIEKLRK